MSTGLEPDAYRTWEGKWGEYAYVDQPTPHRIWEPLHVSPSKLFGYWDADYDKFVSIEIGNDLLSFAPDKFKLIPLYRKDEG